jgi:Ca2+-binding EF-hand superfamily protein
MISGISGVSNYDYLWQLRQYGSQRGNMSAEEVFSKIDTSGDGSISKDEFTAFQSNPQTPFENSAMGSRTDSASLLGLLAALSQAATTGPTAGSGSQSTGGATDELFSKIDTNGDGVISKDELAKARATIHHHHHHHRKSSDATSQVNATSPFDLLFSKIDSNGDGSLSKDELSTFQSKLADSVTGSPAGATGTSTTANTVSDQHSQTNDIQSLLAAVINMYMQFSQLSPALPGTGRFAVTG